MLIKVDLELFLQNNKKGVINIKLHELSLTEILKGLKFKNTKSETYILGNDDKHTEFIRNITYSEYKSLLEFNETDLNKDVEEFENIDGYKTSERIKLYIIPKIKKSITYD